MRNQFVLASAALLTGSLALADTQHPSFESADTNGDGSISKEEFRAFHSEKRAMDGEQTAMESSTAMSSGMTGTPPYPSFQPDPEVKDGYTAEDLRDAAVRGEDGNEVGQVKDLVIDANGQLQRLVVAVNQGFLGSGGQRLAVDWKDIEIGPRDEYGIDYITVSATEGNLEESGIFMDKPDAIRGGDNEWRASELIGDDVDLEDRQDAGYVADLMFDKNGELQAIATATEVQSRVVSFYSPYSGEDAGWDPGDNYYRVPYSEAELEQLMPEDATRASTN